jgi:hypothetical protein
MHIEDDTMSGPASLHFSYFLLKLEVSMRGHSFEDEILLQIMRDESMQEGSLASVANLIIYNVYLA